MIFFDVADRELAEQDWQEWFDGLDDEGKALALAPSPVLSDEEWEACWRSIRGEDDLDPITLDKAAAQAERDAYLELFNSL